MHRIGEVLRGGSVPIIPADRVFVWHVAVGAPVPLVLPGLRIEHDHALVQVAVGHERLVRLGIDFDVCRVSQELRAVAAAGLASLADLHEEPTVIREFQHEVVSAPRVAFPVFAVVQQRLRVADALAAQPDVVVVVDVDAVLGAGPS